MGFLLDQDVYALTARFLRELGHDIVTAAELGLIATAKVQWNSATRQAAGNGPPGIAGCGTRFGQLFFAYEHAS